ncbi:MAG: transglycosylase SLT domain-containing protein [Mariprofundaceae bacterium]
MIQFTRSVCLIALLLMPFISSVEAASAVSKQRLWFMEAKAALETNDLERFQTLKRKLSNYPLLPYLDIWHARKKLEQGDDFDIPKVLSQYVDIPEVTDLRLARIKNLAERGQWPHVAVELEKLPHADRQLPEISMLSLWYTGKKDKALQRFSERWQKGDDFSGLAMRCYQKWQAQGHPTRDEVWERLETFARKGNWQKIRSLEKSLSKADRKQVNRWQAMQQDPLVVLKQWNPDKRQHLAAQMMVHDGLQRLSRNDALSAWKELHRLHKLFEPKKFQKLEQRIALRAAGQHSLLAVKWLAELPEEMQTERTRAWPIRLHLLYGDWLQALQAMKSLPESEQNHSRWSYWQARALEALGKKKEAKALYQLTATGRGYYSFLSAERLGLPYQLGSVNLHASSSSIRELKHKPGIKRAHEWWQLGEAGKATREWNLALNNASGETWKAAAILASDWQWHDHVIQAAFKAGETDALERRFPIAFEQVVASTSQESGLSQSLIWSIIRQESAFNTQAISRVGAKGLMQLRPSTAREVARRHKLSKGAPDLFDPAINIRLGALYLSRLLQRFNHNHAIAAAAYNAGPRRVSRWLESRPFDEADIWIETIPFEETRRYVQQVMAFTVVYDWRQAKVPVGIAAQMNRTKEEG